MFPAVYTLVVSWTAGCTAQLDARSLGRLCRGVLPDGATYATFLVLGGNLPVIALVALLPLLIGHLAWAPPQSNNQPINVFNATSRGRTDFFRVLASLFHLFRSRHGSVCCRAAVAVGG